MAAKPGVKSGCVSSSTAPGCLGLQDGADSGEGIRIKGTDKLENTLDWHFSFPFNYEKMPGVLFLRQQ